MKLLCSKSAPIKKSNETQQPENTSVCINCITLDKSQKLKIKSEILDRCLLPKTNSMAYGTRRFNAAFTRALQ